MRDLLAWKRFWGTFEQVDFVFCDAVCHKATVVTTGADRELTITFTPKQGETVICGVLVTAQVAPSK